MFGPFASQSSRAFELASRHRWVTLSTLCLAVLIAQVDTAIVNLAIHAIGDYFHARIGQLQWVMDSYNLAYAVLLLTGGLLADLWGRRRIFLLGAVIFSAASLLCAVAPSVSILVAGRAAAGAGAALLIPASLAIIRVVWQDPQERAHALGIWAACNGWAFAVGPTIGGLLVHGFGWRSIFLVVIPVGLAAMALAPIAIPESSDPQGRHFDGWAQLLGALTLGGVAFAAIEAHAAPVAAILVLAIAAGAFFLFLRVEAGRGAAALLPLDFFANPAFRGAAIATTGMTFGMYGLLFLLPLTWQSTGRLTATSAGLALLPMAVTFVLISSLSGRLADRLGGRVMMAGGIFTIGCGLVLVGLNAFEASFIPIGIALVLTGVGMGLATGQLMAAAVGAVPAARSGTASSLINVARMAGATVGVAILGSVYALAGSGPQGLRYSMLFGGAVQITCAIKAWRTF